MQHPCHCLPTSTSTSSMASTLPSSDKRCEDRRRDVRISRQRTIRDAAPLLVLLLRSLRHRCPQVRVACRRRDRLGHDLQRHSHASLVRHPHTSTRARDRPRRYRHRVALLRWCHDGLARARLVQRAQGVRCAHDCSALGRHARCRRLFWHLPPLRQTRGPEDGVAELHQFVGNTAHGRQPARCPINVVQLHLCVLLCHTVQHSRGLGDDRAEVQFE
ncbi:hypothetical protein B0H14DRAFT_1170614 [Mycena olivaceomarginata]|nr:hypothetical protein B0H14DRAFT_1170614 [Mycena olivaceomarginata]